MKSFSLFAFCLLSGLIICAQNPNNLVILAQDENKSPIPNVSISIAGVPGPMYTTNSGQIVLQIPSRLSIGDKITLVVSKAGWEVINTGALTAVIPKNGLENPIILVLKKGISTAGLLRAKPIVESASVSSFTEVKRAKTIALKKDNTANYVADITIRAHFISSAYNISSYLKSLDEIHVYPLSKKATLGLEELQRVEEGIFPVRLFFKNQSDAADTLTLQINKHNYPFTLRDLPWVLQKGETDSEKNQWFSSMGELELTVPDPDWVSVNSARMLELKTNHESLLEIVVENMTAIPVSLNSLRLNSFSLSGALCFATTWVNPTQEIVFDWDKIIENNSKDGSWTTINNEQIIVKATLSNPDCLGRYQSFSASIPIQIELEPGKMQRLIFKINEIQSNAQSNRKAPSYLKDWSNTFVYFETDGTVYPRKISVSR